MSVHPSISPSCLTTATSLFRSGWIEPCLSVRRTIVLLELVYRAAALSRSIAIVAALLHCWPLDRQLLVCFDLPTARRRMLAVQRVPDDSMDNRTCDIFYQWEANRWWRYRGSRTLPPATALNYRHSSALSLWTWFRQLSMRTRLLGWPCVRGFATTECSSCLCTVFPYWQCFCP